ncbi:MAG TPA: aspartate kinase [Verrucomicrobiae bacterium]|nr:aspartate kinase [Verrucomicrobiae bacterium]
MSVPTGSVGARPVVHKYGGSSLATLARIRRVAGLVAAARSACPGVVVVVSAMGETTDRLLAQAHHLHPRPPARELDALLATGETVTAPLLAMALDALGVPAVSLSGLQAGIRTAPHHRRARIVDVVPRRILDELGSGRVVVVAGFQGVIADTLETTTLGRGGSDTTAVALAAALRADICEIFTDVRGVFTADPRVVASARRLDRIGYQEMLELAAVGAAVLHPRAVEIGAAHSVPIRVRSTFHPRDAGTLICREPPVEPRQKVRGIAFQEDVVKVTVVRVPDRPGIAAAIFTPLAEAGISVDAIVQNVSHEGLTDLSFTVAGADLATVTDLLPAIVAGVGAASVSIDPAIAKVSVVGTGVLGSPGVAARMFRALADAGINIEMIAASEIRITATVPAAQLTQAVRALHRAYELERL